MEKKKDGLLYGNRLDGKSNERPREVDQLQKTSASLPNNQKKSQFQQAIASNGMNK